jgi:5-methyltetrahydrofolate--homocysteine methyltransferase
MPSDRLAAKLATQRFMLGDGAMGTTLHTAGLAAGTAPELWNVSQPDTIRGIMRAYADAGAEAITTNTFGGNAARLGHTGLAEQAFELNRAAAELGRQAADGRDCLVAGSVGPTGELIEPYGLLTFDDAMSMFETQVRGLVAGGVDFILLETMSQLAEVEAAIKATRRVSEDLSIAASMSFDANGHTMMGVSPHQALETIRGWGVSVIGANCGNGPAEIETVMAQMVERRPGGVYLLAQSNAGLPHEENGETVFDGTPEVMAAYAVKMLRLGVNYIGACCGSTPAHIAAMRVALDAEAANMDEADR